MAEKPEVKNRFGHAVKTTIPEDATLNQNPGHKLRTSNRIVDRQQLHDDSDAKVTIQEVKFEDQTGFVRLNADTVQEPSVPNRFTGPTFLNKRERFSFDGHKMLYHLDRIADWQGGKRFAPVHIDMGLTKFCNVACIYCYAVVQNMTKGTMIQEEALMRYIEDCGRLGVRSIGFIGDGEPTLNPALYDATVLAKKLGIDTAMATNGLLIDMDRAPEMLRDMSYIRINLSAGNAEGFKRVHQSASKNFDILVEKIRSLVKIKKEQNLKCTIGLQMVLIPECFDQVIPEAELGAELGVDYFVIKQCSDSEYQEIGIDYDDYRAMGDVLKQAESLSTADYVVQAKWNKLNVSDDTAIYKNGMRKYDICYGTPFILQISGNGKVYPCGPFFNKDRFLIGDLHEDSFYDLVKGDRYWSVQEDIIKSVDVHKDCAIGCRQDYVNKFLWDLKNPPEHKNFI
ncbi:MAG: radical SAM protein [Magnetococcales bacterium]|nr:radical SAM protein [Magnetococcales bacterium]